MTFSTHKCTNQDRFMGDEIVFKFKKVGDEFPEEVWFEDDVGGSIHITWENVVAALKANGMQITPL